MVGTNGIWRDSYYMTYLVNVVEMFNYSLAELRHCSEYGAKLYVTANLNKIKLGQV